MNARDDKALASPSPKRPKAARAGQGARAPTPLFGTSTRTPPRSLASVSAARQRKLHVGHFAFMRSVVQGLMTIYYAILYYWSFVNHSPFTFYSKVQCSAVIIIYYTDMECHTIYLYYS